MQTQTQTVDRLGEFPLQHATGQFEASQRGRAQHEYKVPENLQKLEVSEKFEHSIRVGRLAEQVEPFEAPNRLRSDSASNQLQATVEGGPLEGPAPRRTRQQRATRIHETTGGRRTATLPEHEPGQREEIRDAEARQSEGPGVREEEWQKGRRAAGRASVSLRINRQREV